VRVFFFFFTLVTGPRRSLGLNMRSGTEAGSYLRLIDSCTTQLKAQGPSRTCNERQEEDLVRVDDCDSEGRQVSSSSSLLSSLELSDTKVYEP